MTSGLGQWLADLLPGLLVSLELTAVLLAMGLPAAILLALGLRSRVPLLRIGTQSIVEIAKGMPALVLIYVLYFGLPQFGADLGAFMSVASALGISFAGYACDSFKAGFDAVPTGQVESAHALGLGRWTTFRSVLLPQALRVALPPVIGWSIVYFQATSLAFAIAVPELLARAYQLATTNFQYFSVIALAAAIYASICIPLSLVAEHVFIRERPRRRRAVASN